MMFTMCWDNAGLIAACFVWQRRSHVKVRWRAGSAGPVGGVCFGRRKESKLWCGFVWVQHEPCLVFCELTQCAMMDDCCKIFRLSNVVRGLISVWDRRQLLWS
jgi:hypothetical protein